MIVSPWSSTNRKKLSGYNGPAIKRTHTHTHTRFPHTGMILELLHWGEIMKNITNIVKFPGSGREKEKKNSYVMP